MKTLVIHPSDTTTDFLKAVYLDKPDWTVVNNSISKSKLIKLIKSHDRIVMMGHGTPHGLLGFGRYVIDSNYVQFLREKSTICIWCNADAFVEKYGLSGFYTGMIISEYGEAYMCSVPTKPGCIEKSNIKFANAIKESIDSDDILLNMKRLYDGENAVEFFNEERLFYK